MAQTQEQIHRRLLELAPPVPEELRAAWQAQAEACAAAAEPKPVADLAMPDQFLILITCQDERHQVELLGRLQAAGEQCKALVS